MSRKKLIKSARQPAQRPDNRPQFATQLEKICSQNRFFQQSVKAFS
jgi:hypothetical protein